MANPIVIDIPHRLGRAEARRRMAAGVGDLARHIPGGAADVTSSWPSEDRMLLDIAAMGQKIAATLDVEDAVLKVSLAVPPMLSFMSGPISAVVRQSAEALLIADKSGEER
jgi:hypothetical protein